MGTLTEVEIFDALSSNLRLAADRCRTLAWHPRRGWQYDEMRRALGLVEGACRQAYYWRDYDSRWLYLAMKVADAAKRAGNWLRDYPGLDGRKEAHPLFQRLAEVLDDARERADGCKNAATGHIGPILPAPERLIRTEGRPVQMMTPGGVLLP